METPTDIHIVEIKSGSYTKTRAKKAWIHCGRVFKTAIEHGWMNEKPVLLHYVVPRGDHYISYMKEFTAGGEDEFG